ncbi:MAG TPA: TrkA family potassium uptake protein [Candidatus Bipolaricaulis sp.]|nr:TrkA family potassium uptake protein [Candidatus Bipolaricaulis sp.]HPD06705.1 TrkA family potassium uptake protein [Candidatus Bipolaricaulis sp.]HRS13504.1 TrkA family potassium uptake protein [Candidatus Bipolaricaulis sp.]HRU22066.1 TrkA family potassium uptake protein [Candidatus Bipolaricaulis sp.]
MYLIVVGAGGIGSAIIDLAVRDRHNVAVIERDPKKAEAIIRRYDVLVFNADAASADILREAGAERADALIATTHDDATNLMVIAAAGDLGVPTIVAVVNNPEHADLFRRLGAHVMENPDIIVAGYLYHSAWHPHVRDLVALPGGAQVFRITITANSPLVDLTLREAGKQGLIPEGLLIAAVERNGDLVIPSGSTVIRAGDNVTVFTKGHVPQSTIEQLTG